MSKSTKSSNRIFASKNSREALTDNGASRKKLGTDSKKSERIIQPANASGNRAKDTSVSKNNVPQTHLLSREVREAIQKAHDQYVSPPKGYRRLDSLARLLEGNSLCAAAYFDGKKILITSNKLGATSREDNETKRLINEILDYYLQLVTKAKHRDIAQLRKTLNDERIKLFQNICIKNICGQMGKATIAGCDEYINKFASYVLALPNDPINDSKNTGLHKFKEFVGQEVRDAKVGMLFGACIVAIPRLARDFRKLENYFIREGKTLLKKDPVIIQHGTKLHAEMQLIQEVIVNNGISKIGYIGISKLCCLDCASVILAINIGNGQGQQLDEEFKVLTRGQHDICFNDKWKMPDFLKKDRLLRTLYSSIKQYIQKKYSGDKYSSMMPPHSDSPPTTE